jgi:hypothetical protein
LAAALDATASSPSDGPSAAGDDRDHVDHAAGRHRRVQSRRRPVDEHLDVRPEGGPPVAQPIAESRDLEIRAVEEFPDGPVLDGEVARRTGESVATSNPNPDGDSRCPPRPCRRQPALFSSLQGRIGGMASEFKDDVVIVQ